MFAQEEIATVLLFITAMASYLNHRYLQLPKSIGLTFVTFFISIGVLVLDHFHFEIAASLIQIVSNFEFSQTFLQRMLGFLLFAGSLQIDARDLYKQKLIIALLSTVSVLISTAVIGFATWFMMQVTGLNVPLLSCFLFGSLISPTDPVAVMSILKSCKAPKSLEMKIAGEALFNDAMGIVLFVALGGMIQGTIEISVLGFIIFFVRQAIGGMLFGLFCGKAFSHMIANIDSAFVLIMMTISLVSSSYLLAEHCLEVSAVITIGVAGLYIGNTLRQPKFDPQLSQHLNEFWEFVDEILNAILFTIIGLEFLEIHTSTPTFIACIGTIGITVIARWISVALPLTWITGLSYVNSQLIWLMTWGGMRGGISVALALMLPLDNPHRSTILAITYAVVIFSIIVQGMTIAPLMQQMNLSKARLKPIKVEKINIDETPSEFITQGS